MATTLPAFDPSAIEGGLTTALFDHSADCIKVLDVDGRLLAMSAPGLCAMEIDDLAPFVGQPWAEMWPPAAREQIDAAVELALGGGVGHLIAACPTAKGTPKWWDVTVAPILAADGSVERLLSVSKDITALLRRSEARSLLAQEAGGVGTFEMDLAEGVLRGSPMFGRLYGRSASAVALPHADWLAMVHPDDRDDHQRAFATALAEADSFTSEYRITRPDGETRWLSSRIRIERDAAGRATGVIGVQQDITDAKRNERLWRTLLASIPDGLVIADDQGIITSVSSTAERLFGYDAAELVGCNLKILMSEALASRHEAQFERYLRTGEQRAIGRTNRMLPQRKDGSSFPAEIVIGEALSDGQRTFFGFVRDISEREAAADKLSTLQTEYAKAARVGSMGQLAASIAHELNQPLAAIANYTAGAARIVGPDADPRLVAAIAGAQEQALRAGDIIKALRAFVSGSAARPSSLELADVVHEATTLAMVDGRATGVHLTIDCPRDLAVMADRVQVQQLIFNLVRNAVEAMATSSTRHVGIRARGEGQEVTIEVEDSGPGLPVEADFDPFELFASSKPEGMGVGLALCRTIAEANGGRIWSERRDSGATFVFTLPHAATDL